MVKGKGRLGVLLALALTAVFILTLQGPAAEGSALPDQITLSWTADPQTTQTVAWRLSGAAAGKVQYMKASEFKEDFSGALEKEAVCSELYSGYNHFEAVLDNLQPGVTYVYRVGAEGCWSGQGAFTTAAPTGSFSFMYMGDVQKGFSQWGQLLQQACVQYPELKFAMLGGDLVDTADNTDEWSDFFGAAAGVFGRIPLMPALGNHEYESPALYFKQFALPQNGPAGYEEHHYSFDYGNAHFVVLDSNLMGSEGSAYEAGIAWLESDLQNSGKKWKFAMFHHPPYTVNSGDAGDTGRAAAMREKWLPVMERNGVDMVFVGHQHMYMRTYPMYEGQVKEKAAEGITYVMGVAGEKFYVNPEDHDYIASLTEKKKCYTVININGGVLTMTTRDADGNVLDQYKFNKEMDMEGSVTVSSVKVLDSSYQEISSVTARGHYRLQAHLNNNTSSPQSAVAVLQVRGGSGAAADGGGEPLGIASVKADVPASGMDVYADFTLPDMPAGRAYVDVLVWDEAGAPIDVPCQNCSFDITSI